jgi:RNA polymerase sigma-70 factor (ECF subfamily)
MPHPISTDRLRHRQNENELALLQRVAQDDREALAALYRSYHRRLFGFLVRFANRHGLVEEIINDTLLTVWRKAGEFRGQSTVSTWIIGIAYRHALKSLRRQDAWLRVESDATRDADAVEVDPSGETHDWIAHGLARLSHDQRMTLELAYYFGHSCEEIADITQCPVNTVKTRLFNARRKLRELLPELADGHAALQ